eukprot:jgi/Chlat1/8185/Chrsp76S09204
MLREQLKDQEDTANTWKFQFAEWTALNPDAAQACELAKAIAACKEVVENSRDFYMDKLMRLCAYILRLAPVLRRAAREEELQASLRTTYKGKEPMQEDDICVCCWESKPQGEVLKLPCYGRTLCKNCLREMQHISHAMLECPNCRRFQLLFLHRPKVKPPTEALVVIPNSDTDTEDLGNDPGPHMFEGRPRSRPIVTFVLGPLHQLYMIVYDGNKLLLVMSTVCNRA